MEKIAGLNEGYKEAASIILEFNKVVDPDLITEDNLDEILEYHKKGIEYAKGNININKHYNKPVRKSTRSEYFSDPFSGCRQHIETSKIYCKNVLDDEEEINRAYFLSGAIFNDDINQLCCKHNLSDEDLEQIVSIISILKKESQKKTISLKSIEVIKSYYKYLLYKINNSLLKPLYSKHGMVFNTKLLNTKESIMAELLNEIILFQKQIELKKTVKTLKF